MSKLSPCVKQLLYFYHQEWLKCFQIFTHPLRSGSLNCMSVNSYSMKKPRMNKARPERLIFHGFMCFLGYFLSWLFRALSWCHKNRKTHVMGAWKQWHFAGELHNSRLRGNNSSLNARWNNELKYNYIKLNLALLWNSLSGMKYICRHGICSSRL